MKIAFYDTHKYDRDSFDLVNQEYNFQIEYFDFKLTARSAMTAKGYDAVCIFVNDVLDKECIKILANCGVKLIVLRCSGFNNVDLDAAANHFVKVVRVPAYSPETIAEYTVGLLLAITRKIPQSYVRTKSGNFTLEGLCGRNLKGLTAGIVGTGKIGRQVAHILSGFGMNILVSDKFPDIYWSNHNNFEYVSSDYLFSNSDVISLHCPLNSETKYIINEKSISQMKKDVVIINTGRGGLIETKALVYALKNHLIGGAALDVYEEENRYFFSDWSESVIDDDTLIRLLTFPNVIITSHQAFLTNEALFQIAKTSLENISKIFKNEVCQNIVVL